MSPLARRRSLGEVYAIPLALGVSSLVGLVSALIGDGLWDVLSWVTLTTPLLPIAALARGRRRTTSARRQVAAGA